MPHESRSAIESPQGVAAASRPRSRPPSSPAENRAMGLLIKTFRQRHHLSQSQFAHHLGILPSALSRIERGTQTVPASLFWRIAHAFNVPLDAAWHGTHLPPDDAWTTLHSLLRHRLPPAQYAALALALDALLHASP